MPASVTIFGSTGSIGVSSLRVIRSLGERFSIYGLSCFNNLDALERQIREFSPAVVAVGDTDVCTGDRYRMLAANFPDVEFLEGAEGILELSRRKVDTVISAIVGAAGMMPTLESIPHTRRIALANKETLVMSGEIIGRCVREHGVELIPVDSEHSAVFTLLEHMERTDVARIILTASGGSLRDLPLEELEYASPEMALAHPTWNMGSKITVDSATLMNKGLEVIEAHFLFDMEYDRISVLIHPESIIHSMVETRDGGVHAYLSVTDMALPIHNALLYPEKEENPFGKLDLLKHGALTFREFEPARYPALELCYEAGRQGGTMPAVLNAANETAVRRYLNGEIRFTDIAGIVEKVMAVHRSDDDAGLNDIINADAWARAEAYSITRG